MFRLGLLTVSILLLSCEQEKIDGESLSKSLCIGCHQYPEPELLDKSTWRNFVLPRMGYMYGIYSSDSIRASLFEPNDGGETVLAQNVFPEKQIIASKHWNAIVDYYLDKAPSKLAASGNKNFEEDLLQQFNLRMPSLRLRPPSTTLIHAIDSMVFLGDANKASLMLFDKNLTFVRAAKLREAPVHIQKFGEAYYVTMMGSFSPTDQAKGMLVKLDSKGNEALKVVLRDLQRPVHAAYSDINNDGNLDIVVSEFGKWTGALSLWYGDKNGEYLSHILSARSGAIKSYIRDLNEDGKLDVLCLFGQGDEGIHAFINQGQNKFKDSVLLRFPPSYGSSFFDLIDFDGDGDEDIVYCAGDNADYLPILKPYHGIYLFENKTNSFVLKRFFPLHGAYGAALVDFDGDGDLDIAAVSFFPDWENEPGRSFVYYQNEGGDYRERRLPSINQGRWMVMHCADLDADGDTDILLGGLTFETVPELGLVDQWVENGVPFMMLENKLR